MATAKEQIKQLLEEQPDNSSYDEIIRELVFKRMIDKGLNDISNNKTISNSGMKEQIQEWIK